METAHDDNNWLYPPIARKFVRAKVNPAWLLENEDARDDDDSFFMGIAFAEMAAHHDEIDCAACGSRDVCRSPLSHPDMFGTLRTPAGSVYGYAFCRPCSGDREASSERVDAAFDAVAS